MSHPIELEQFKTAIKDISEENIHSVKDQLFNSLTKLYETNSVLRDEIAKVNSSLHQLAPEESHDHLKQDWLLFTESIEENNKVIIDQKKRVLALVDELHSRGLVVDVDREKKLLEQLDYDETKEPETTATTKEGVYL